jgi:hypothetical protein
VKLRRLLRKEPNRFTAKCETERAASREQLMEEVCERGNCLQAYKPVTRRAIAAISLSWLTRSKNFSTRGCFD